MTKIAGFGLLLLAAIAIGTAGTLTKVMSQKAYEPICPPGWAPDPKQTASDMLNQDLMTCVNGKGEVKDVPLSKGGRESLCASLGKPQNC
jgi:hypothetical protein